MIDTAALSLPLTEEFEYFTQLHVPRPAAVDAARLIEPGELEPYRALLVDYLGRHERDTAVDTDVIIANAEHWNFTVPRFFHWLATTHPDRLTVPQGNTEGDPMPLTTDEIAALEAATDGVAETQALRDCRLEPYRALLTEFNLTRCKDSEDAAARATVSMIDTPSSWFVTLPQFFRWMRDNHKVHPGHETSEPEVTTFHVGDRVSYVEHPQNVMLVGDVRVVLVVHDGEVDLGHADGPLAGEFANGHVTFDRLALVSCPHDTVEAEPVVTVTGGFHVGDVVQRSFDGKRSVVTACPERYRSWGEDGMHYWGISDGDTEPTFTFERPTLVSCPHQPLDLPEPTVPQGNGNDGAEWGPSHPEWAGWWERARTLAERFGYGSQYDALAEQLGGPSRVAYDMVTVTIQFPLEQDRSVTRDLVRTAVDTHGFSVADRRPR